MGQLQIVVADSSPLVRGIFTSLPSTQYTIKAYARNRVELEHAVANHRLDAIICSDELGCPLGGLDAIRQMRRKNQLSSDTAVLLMVNNPSKEHLLACTQAMPDAILLQPFSLHTVITRIERAVQLRQQNAYLRNLEAAGRWDELLTQARFRQAATGPTRSQAAQFEVKALEKLGRDAECDARLAQLLHASPGLLWAEEALARRELARGDWKAAESRLVRLVGEHPTHIEAQELLYQFKLDQNDFRGAQRPLMKIAQNSGNLERTRELGHLALFNGDLDSAVMAYSSALQAPGMAQPVEDLVNFMRALLLKGDSLAAIQSLNHHRLRGGRDAVLSILEHFVTAARARALNELGVAQADVFRALQLIDGFVPGVVPQEMLLLAIEQCLAMELTYQAAERSWAMLSDRSRPIHCLQGEWLMRLHDWARDTPEEGILPKGLRPTRSIST